MYMKASIEFYKNIKFRFSDNIYSIAVIFPRLFKFLYRYGLHFVNKTKYMTNMILIKNPLI